jgi:GNAT superfamily N-acetyltransferase
LVFAFLAAMQNPPVFEIVGYIASVLIAISVMNTNVLRLRIFNVMGAACFLVYGFLIKAWPVVGLNFFVVCVNAVHLYKIFSSREFFKILEVPADSTYLRHFLAHHLKDIRRHYPGFDYQPGINQVTLFVLRDTVPAGLFIGEVLPNGDLNVTLDYVAPDYRDLKVARFLLQEQVDFFRERGVKRLVSSPGTDKHAKYLKNIGFIPAPVTEDTDIVFIRSVA